VKHTDLLTDIRAGSFEKPQLIPECFDSSKMTTSLSPTTASGDRVGGRRPTASISFAAGTSGGITTNGAWGYGVIDSPIILIYSTPPA
jgi:hypothetical protein